MSVFVYLIRKYLSIPTPGGTASGRERLVDIIIRSSLPKLREKLLEALQAVLPIAAIVLVLCFSIAPVSPSILLCFLLGAAMIIVGIMFFTLGAEMSMTPMGERVGSMLTRSQNLFLIIGVGFLLGFLITISEPDLQVLANQVPSIPNMTLILSVAVGVGIFLVMAFLRMLLGIPLPRLLVIFYAAIFLLAAFVPKEFLAVAFDSGGVTTGPMTVPFIMALGVGVSAIRSDRHAADDSFGLVALCSVGPILAVLILGIGAVLMFVGGTGLRWFLLAGAGGVGAIGAAVAVMPDLVPYAADRLRSWLDPFADPLGDGHQTIQSLYAIGSGGATGLGLGESRQKHLFVPEPQNDFIFSIVCEELGFVGACAVVGLFVLLLCRGITIAAHAPDRFGALLVVGFVVQVALQAVLNVAVVTNTIPNTGISLPFFSSGGTSLMMLLGEMGVVLGVSRGS